MTTTLRVFPTLAALGEGAADALAALSEQAIAARGRAFVALSGGETPRALYQALARRSLPWREIALFFSDERMVPPDDARSNYHLAYESLLSVVHTDALRVHGEASSAVRAAEAYEAEIERAVPEHVFDVVLLGLGGDGHTASLFPGSPALRERERLVVATASPRGELRVSFALSLLAAARCALFLVAGEAKAEALAAVFRGDPESPANKVRSARRLWFVDQAAARLLERERRSHD